MNKSDEKVTYNVLPLSVLAIATAGRKQSETGGTEPQSAASWWHLHSRPSPLCTSHFTRLRNVPQSKVCKSINADLGSSTSVFCIFASVHLSLFACRFSAFLGIVVGAT